MSLRASTAHVADVAVERGLFTAAGDMGDLVTRAGRYAAQASEGAGLDKLSLALQQRLAFAELQLAVSFRAAHAGDDDLLVVDGPLRGRTHLDRTVGYIKTHHASYLPGPQAAVVGALKPGQRTPAFTMGTSWQRNSWYLQLPGTDGVPWSGVVRLECSADLEPKDVTRLADLTARVLPPFANLPHKDPRAPQNLVPISGLERQLKHRLGDERLLYRALRAAAMSAPAEPRVLWCASELPDGGAEVELAQWRLEYLAVGVARQRVRLDGDELRHLVVGEVLAGVADDRTRIDRRAG